MASIVRSRAARVRSVLYREDPGLSVGRRQQVTGTPLEQKRPAETLRPRHHHGRGAPDRSGPTGRGNGDGVAGRRARRRHLGTPTRAMASRYGIVARPSVRVRRLRWASGNLLARIGRCRRCASGDWWSPSTSSTCRSAIRTRRRPDHASSPGRSPPRTGRDRPFLVFLQGGPGMEAPRPTVQPWAPGWLERALRDFRVLLLDHAGPAVPPRSAPSPAWSRGGAGRVTWPAFGRTRSCSTPRPSGPSSGSSGGACSDSLSAASASCAICPRPPDRWPRPTSPVGSAGRPASRRCVSGDLCEDARAVPPLLRALSRGPGAGAEDPRLDRGRGGAARAAIGSPGGCSDSSAGDSA